MSRMRAIPVSFQTLRWISAILVASLMSPPLIAEVVTGKPGVAKKRAVINLDDLPESSPRGPEEDSRPRDIPYRRRPAREQPVSPVPDAPASENPVSKANVSAAVARTTPPPAANFLALGDDDTSIPPDTHGAVGPKHLMVTLNTQVRMMTRNGAPLRTVSLNKFWSSLGTLDTFDPRALYDPFGKRWITVAVANAASPSSAVLIGVSTTPDPTKAWNLYLVDADGRNATFADLPVVGFDKKWIVVSVNMYTNASDEFDRVKLFVFNKADLYADGAGKFTELADTSGFSMAPAITHSSTLTTHYLLDEWNNAQGTLRLSKLTGPVDAPVLTKGIALPDSGSSWAANPAGFADFAPQLGAKLKIQANDSRMNVPIVYRNGSLWAVHPVFLPAVNPKRSAIQWWRISTSGAVRQRGLIQDATGKEFYAYPSIAVNKDDGAVIGYSRFSANRYASAGYSYRAKGDPANTFRPGFILKKGEAPYVKTFGGSENRWGDYSATVVDPLNDRDFWTIQEYAATPKGGIDRWGTWWGRIDLDAVLADLALTQTDSPDPVAKGKTVAFNLTVTNKGPGAAKNIVLTDTLPANASFVSIRASRGSCSGGATPTCKLGSLNKGASATVRLTLKALTASNIINTANVTGAVIDPVRENNTDTEAANERCFGKKPTLAGGKGDNHLRGTAGADVIIGRGGNDVIEGLGGNDLLCGDTGNDILKGGSGNDSLHGGRGTDWLQGGANTDTCAGAEHKTGCEL